MRIKKLLLSLGLGVFFVGLLVTVYMRKVQNDAEVLAENGKELRQVLNSIGLSLEKGSIANIYGFFGPEYSTEVNLQLEQNFQTELTRDGVYVGQWSAPQLEEDNGEAPSINVLRKLIQETHAEIPEIYRARFKLVRVEKLLDAGSVIRAELWIRGRNERSQSVESWSTFRIWLAEGEGGLKIREDELLRSRIVVGDRKAFTDITDEGGIAFQVELNPRWETPGSEPRYMEASVYASGGVATADYNGDGWLDLFFADAGKARLYENNGDGSFTDVTAQTGLPTDMIGVNVALFADFDNDGDQDLLLGNGTEENRIFRNDDNSSYVDVSENSDLGGALVSTAAIADYDNDGLLDIYMGRYLDARKNGPTTFFYSRNGEVNSLLRNMGDMEFEDVTVESNLGDVGLALGIAWADYNNDGFQDIYLANDFGRNALYENDGMGRFTDVAEERGALDWGYGMSSSWGDIDNDGDLDIYVSNMHSSQRWFAQAATLYKYLWTSVINRTVWQDLPLYLEIVSYEGMSWASFGDWVLKGNSLLLNDSTGQFNDVAESTYTNPYGWYWGSGMFDFDNDGWQDIYAVNGWISATSQTDI